MWKWLFPIGLALLLSPAAMAADIAGDWKIAGSVFFHAVDTICHFKKDGDAILATCDNESGPGTYTPATVSGSQVSWSWDSGPAVLAFQAALTSDTVMKGEIKVRGFTGSFKATKQ